MSKPELRQNINSVLPEFLRHYAPKRLMGYPDGTKLLGEFQPRAYRLIFSVLMWL